MKSSTGAHFLGLDYIRAIATFMVVSWHFMHEARGIPVPFEGVPYVPFFSLLDEGHAGVALFMVLSGYLFAKLLDGRDINYAPFLFNRFLRLAPLLIFVMILVGIKKSHAGENINEYLASLLHGFYAMSWPNGGWSIAVEMHFYLLLPFILAAGRRWRMFAIFAFLSFVALRALILAVSGDIYYLSYGTIVGRIDQFLMGIIFWNFRDQLLKKKNILFALIFGYLTFQFYFNARGGAFRAPRDEINQLIWLFMPAIEALGFASFVLIFDSLQLSEGGFLKSLIQKVGEYSYSIYLLHSFFVFKFAQFIDKNVMVLDNVYIASVWAAIFVVLMLPLGYISFRFLESPFLKYRRRYIR